MDYSSQASLFITNSRSLLKFMSTESVMPSNSLILCCPRLLLASIFPSIRVFSNESALHIRWPKYWSFSSPRDSQESSPAPQFESITSLVLRFLYSPLSHPYMTTGKTIALTRHTFLRKVMSLLFNILSRLIIAFLPRNKCLLISWLQSPSAVILESPKYKVCQCVHCFPIYLPWSDGTRCHDLSFLNDEF